MASGFTFMTEDERIMETIRYQILHPIPHPLEFFVFEYDDETEVVDDNIEADIEELTVAFSCLTLSSPPSSLTSSMEEELRTFDYLLQQLSVLGRLAREREALGQEIALVREEIAQNPQPDSPCVNRTPQGRIWQIASVAGFFMIVLIIRVSSY